jgi:hypothetical protein
VPTKTTHLAKGDILTYMLKIQLILTTFQPMICIANLLIMKTLRTFCKLTGLLPHIKELQIPSWQPVDPRKSGASDSEPPAYL